MDPIFPTWALRNETVSCGDFLAVIVRPRVSRFLLFIILFFEIAEWGVSTFNFPAPVFNLCFFQSAKLKIISISANKISSFFFFSWL